MSGQVRVIKPRPVSTKIEPSSNSTSDLDDLIVHLKHVNIQNISKEISQNTSNQPNGTPFRNRDEKKEIRSSLEEFEESNLYAGGAFEKEPDPKDLPLPSNAFISNLKKLRKSKSSGYISQKSLVSSHNDRSIKADSYTFAFNRRSQAGVERNYTSFHNYHPQKRTQFQPQQQQQQQQQQQRKRRQQRASSENRPKNNVVHRRQNRAHSQHQ
jgi:hypothetical protein